MPAISSAFAREPLLADSGAAGAAGGVGVGHDGVLLFDEVGCVHCAALGDRRSRRRAARRRGRGRGRCGRAASAGAGSTSWSCSAVSTSSSTRRSWPSISPACSRALRAREVALAAAALAGERRGLALRALQAHGGVVDVADGLLQRLVVLRDGQRDVGAARVEAGAQAAGVEDRQVDRRRHGDLAVGAVQQRSRAGASRSRPAR